MELLLSANNGSQCVTAEYQQCLAAWNHIRRMAQAPETIIDINIKRRSIGSMQCREVAALKETGRLPVR